MLVMLARKQNEFDQYARDSALANSTSDAKGTSEESMAKVIVFEERKRLVITSTTDEVSLIDDET